MVVAKSAMVLKRSGVEPSVVKVIAQCPKATTNPDTGLSFTAPTILEVFRALCYDIPECPWTLTSPFQKTALPPEINAARPA